MVRNGKGAHLPVVDAELLEAVDGEVLESGDVEDADVVGGPLEGDALVDLGHDVVEEAGVGRLGQRVPSTRSLVRLQRHHDHRPLVPALRSLHHASGQRAPKLI